MSFELLVNGTLMRHLKLQNNLAGVGFLGVAATKPVYRIYSIGDVNPGMFEVAEGGWAAIEAGEPPNRYRGKI